MLRRRYITQAWRDTAVRHGFEEIDGPTFEEIELYKKKSGEGIVSEMFGVFSGKDEAERQAIREGADAPYALRPEFTPTLARMYAARAASLPKPTKWFSIGPFFRAERPQRGRLREFLQWNVDVLGTDATVASRVDGDLEALSCLQGFLERCGMTPAGCRIHIGSKDLIEAYFRICGVTSEQGIAAGFQILDRVGKVPTEHLRADLTRLGLSDVQAISLMRRGGVMASMQEWKFNTTATFQRDNPLAFSAHEYLESLQQRLIACGVADWSAPNEGVVRGLAYYTGMVFEVIAEGERAVAGGGRYDNLIELMGGPASPAVGFAMGDVVLSLLLEDKGLMPEGKDLLEAVSRPPASVRPDVFVIGGRDQGSGISHQGEGPDPGSPIADPMTPLVARLRRGQESKVWLDRADRKPWDSDRYAGAGDDDPAFPPLHARRSYRATKNLGRLLKEASDAGARFAFIIDDPESSSLRDLDRGGEAEHVRITDLGPALALRLARA
jgi:histidyl-tRNA synthetase